MLWSFSHRWALICPGRAAVDLCHRTDAEECVHSSLAVSCCPLASIPSFHSNIASIIYDFLLSTYVHLSFVFFESFLLPSKSIYHVIICFILSSRRHLTQFFSPSLFLLFGLFLPSSICSTVPSLIPPFFFLTSIIAAFAF